MSEFRKRGEFMKKTNQRGFTLIELLVVIAIIGLLSTLAVVALNNARQKSRDAKRVADIKQIQTALEMYYNECDAYPAGDASSRLSGSSQAASGSCAAGNDDIEFSKFMSQIPEPPTPADGSCTTDNNTYYYVSCNATGGTCNNSQIASYVIEFCLGASTGQIAAGAHYAVPSGITDTAGSSGL